MSAGCAVQGGAYSRQLTGACVHAPLMCPQRDESASLFSLFTEEDSQAASQSQVCWWGVSVVGGGGWESVQGLSRRDNQEAVISISVLCNCLQLFSARLLRTWIAGGAGSQPCGPAVHRGAAGVAHL